VPLEYLLSETDCPFLTPEPHRGHRNQPAYVKYVVKRIAYLTGVDEDYVAQTLVENAKKAFQIQ
jgi:TatD DNase family protein